MTSPVLTEPVTIRLVSKSSTFQPLAQGALGTSLLDRVLNTIRKHVTGDLCPAYGFDPGLITIASGQPTDTDWVLLLADDQDPSDLGWHDDEGTPGGWIGVQEILSFGGFPLIGSGPMAPSVASVIAHEVDEMLCDPLATLWSPMPDGRDVAFEVCDPCQATAYRIDDVEVSDFVLPSWFDPTSAGPWTKCGGKGPLALSDGGYMAIRNGDGSISQQNAYAVEKRLIRAQVVEDRGFWEQKAKRETSRFHRRAGKR